MEHNSESYIVVKEFTDKGKTTREVIAKGVTKQGFIDAYTEKGCVMRGGENPHFEDIYSGVIYKLESHFEQGGQVDRQRDIEIAKIILMQLGGSNRLQMFTGAYNFVAVPYGVSFRIKNRSVNYVKIVLNAMDTYDIEFGRISGVNYKIVKELSGIYNDQLVEVFTRYTGMVLRLSEGGAIQGEENAEMVMNQNLQIRHHTEELEEILKSGKEVPAWVVSKISRAADSMSDATHYLEGTPDKMARGGGLNRMMANKFQKASFYFKELENRMSEKQKKFFNALLKRRQPSFEKNFTDTEIANYINGEIEEQFGIDLGIKKYDITGQNWFKLGFKFIAYRESIEEPDFWEDNPIPQNMPNPEPEPLPEPDFNIEQVKGEIEALKELLPFLEGDDKKEIEEQIDILSIALKQNENFGGGAEKEQIKQWYRINYPDDDLGNELNDAITFEDLWNGLHNGSDVYEIIGVGDSDIRKDLFWRLSEIYGVDYNYVYLKWLDSDEPDAPNADENFSQKVYIDFLNKKKGFKQDRIYFNSYEEAKDWAIKNFERFDPDMIKTKYAKGGGVGTHIDLFEDYENMPPKIAKIFDKYSEDFEDGNYKGLSMALKEMQQIGYTFEYYLDGQAYGLRPIGVPLNQLKGYEDFEEDYAKGGGVYDSADGISPAIQNAFNSLQNEGYFEKEAIEYVGGIKEWNKLSAIEKEIIISDIEKDWSKSTFFAKGGGVGKEILDAEFWEDIAHLWRTRHIDIDKNGNWYNTEKYKGVNNTSGLYFTNESANLIVGLANSYNVTLLDIKNNNPNYTAFDYDKKRLEEFRNKEYANGGGVGNFPPKGELKNKENLLLKYEKIGSDYEFFVYKPEKRDVSSYGQIKYVCVNKDCPTRMSYNQFLNYLYAETYLDDRKYAKGGEVFVCPVGTQIQTLIFDKSMFNLRQAKAWAKKNNFKNDFVDGKLNTFRIRQKDPTMFTEDGFRTIQLRQGVQAVIGCPKKRTIRRKK